MLILTRVLGLCQSIEFDQGLDKKSRQSFIGAPEATGGIESKRQVSLLVPQGRVEVSLFLI